MKTLLSEIGFIRFSLDPGDGKPHVVQAHVTSVSETHFVVSVDGHENLERTFPMSEARVRLKSYLIFRLHGESETGILCLQNDNWLCVEVMTLTLRSMADALSWGYGALPPILGHNIWIASSDMFCTWKGRCGDGQACLIPSLDGGITGDWGQRYKEFTDLSEEEKVRIKRRSLCVRFAYIPINKLLGHWIYARIDFKEAEILLVDSMKTTESVFNLDALTRLSMWYKMVCRARGEDDKDPTLKIVTSITQTDGYNCGVHVVGNILSNACNINSRVDDVVPKDIRLWMCMVIWMSDTLPLRFSHLEWDRMPKCVKSSVELLDNDGIDGQVRCKPDPSKYAQFCKDMMTIFEQLISDSIFRAVQHHEIKEVVAKEKMAAGKNEKIALKDEPRIQESDGAISHFCVCV